MSFLTTTLSSQVNNLLSQIANNVSLGFNVRGAGLYDKPYSSLEYEGAILYQPNNRLVINGNFGYRNDNLSKNKFIGDLDIEYILTHKGKFRLKAYNHTVDRYTLRSAQFIQGVGLMYKETFNSWDELIKHYWNTFILRKKIETQTQEIKNDTIK
ncbi:MAG: translocation/assembly module TamB domain-containing protein [Paludibacteraceae bacterium]